MADAVMDAGCDRRDWNHDTGVPDRMCCQPMARLGSLGLQQSSGEYFGADLLWLPVSLAGIVLDDWIRYRAFGEERPHYRLI